MEEPKENSENRVNLISIYKDSSDDSINFDFNLKEEETIIGNNLVLIGFLEKIKKILLDLDNLPPSTEESEENSE